MIAPEIARIRARISIAKARPSAVAVIGPSWKRTVWPPGKKKRLTSRTLIAIGRLNRIEKRSSSRSTPDSAAGISTATPTMTNGQSTPPRTTAAAAVTSATTSLVSGFSR